MMRIIALDYSDHDMSLYAVRDDGVRLRLKRNPPAYVRRTGVARTVVGPVEHAYWMYDPVAAVNEWLGFS